MYVLCEIMRENERYSNNTGLINYKMLLTD